MLKIAISGAHSTGKSTTFAALADALLKNGLRPAVVHGSNAGGSPFPILQEQTALSTAWIIADMMAKEIAALSAASELDVLLVDRPIVDPLGYLRAAANNHATEVDRRHEMAIDQLVDAWLPTYDLILSTTPVPGIAVAIRGRRTTSIEYRSEVARQIHSEYESRGVDVLALTGDLSADVISVVNAIKIRLSSDEAPKEPIDSVDFQDGDC